MNGAPAGSISGVNERGSGYIDGNLFVRWSQHFVAVTNCSRAQPHLLILDGHESHKTLQATDFAHDNWLTVISLPPHASHRMQPLDRALFESLKSGYSKAVNNWMLSNRGRRLTQFDIVPLFATAYKRSSTVDSATKGFSITEIWPFDDAVFDAELQAPIQANPPGGQGPANPRRTSHASSWPKASHASSCPRGSHAFRCPRASAGQPSSCTSVSPSQSSIHPRLSQSSSRPRVSQSTSHPWWRWGMAIYRLWRTVWQQPTRRRMGHVHFLPQTGTQLRNALQCNIWHMYATSVNPMMT